MKLLHVMEVLLLVTVGIAFIASVLPRRWVGRWAWRCAVVAMIVVALDIVFGHWRWQILPAYSLALLLVITAYRGSRTTAERTWLGRIGLIAAGLVGVVWLAVAVALPAAFPMFDVPAPSGPYRVGIADLHLIDESRAEHMSQDPSDRRELMIRAWYPADVAGDAKPEPFLREVEPLRQVFAQIVTLPEFMLAHLTRIPSHSYLDAPLVAGKPLFPVLIFSHGNGFYASQNTLLMEHLASHGYAVLSIEHPYQASSVRFPDGRVVTYKDDWIPSAPPSDPKEERRKVYRALSAGSYDEYFERVSEWIRASPQLNQGTKYWMDDTAFVLDRLAEAGTGGANGLDRFRGRLDLERVGIFGMSYGGAVAGGFCARDRRCKAGINMDGLQFGEGALDIHLEQPFMLMNADRRGDFASLREEGVDLGKPLAFEMNDFVYHQSNNVVYSLVVADSTHANYSDFGLMSRALSWIGAVGSVDVRIMRDLLNDYTLAFFDKHLKGERAPLLDGPSKEYPQVLKFSQRDGRPPSE